VTATVQGFPTSQIFGWVGNQSGAPDMLVNIGLPDAATPYFWEHINFDPDGGVNLLGCSSPEATSLIAEGKRTGSADTFSAAAEAAQSTGCWMNLVDVSDFVVAQPWLKGIEAAHVVTYPATLSLNQLHL
jgi:peptide/nickel transport system substrate-binding protein